MACRYSHRIQREADRAARYSGRWELVEQADGHWAVIYGSDAQPVIAIDSVHEGRAAALARLANVPARPARA